MQKQRREELGVQPGDQIVVKGTISFARLDKAISGEALVQENNRRAAKGMNPMPEFRSVAIENPEVVQGQGTPLATYHTQRIYLAGGSGKPTMSFESKSPFPPAYGHMQNDGSAVNLEDPQKNPAPGQVVFLVISAYGKKGFNNLGSSFDQVIFAPGEIKYYEGGKGGGIAGFGQLMNIPIQTNSENQQTVPGAQSAPQGEAFNVGQTQAFNGYNQEPAPAPQGELVGAGVGQTQTFNSYNQAPAANPNQGQGDFSGYNPQGFSQAPVQNNNPFGIQEGSVPNQGNPFNNNGQPGKSPYA